MNPVLIIFRHGQTDYNKQRRFQGQLDIPLNETGRVQAAHTAGIVAGMINAFAHSGGQVKEFVSSDLIRAHETAKIVWQESWLIWEKRLPKLPNINLAAALREYSCGVLEGKTAAEYELTQRDEFKKYIQHYESDPQNACHPGGESRLMMANRLSPLIENLSETCKEPYPYASLSKEMVRGKSDIHVWSCHGGVVDNVVELLGGSLPEENRIIGNGDVLLLAPVRKKIWTIVRHYRVGDDVAARIVPV